jgi:hypothetical protein
LRVKGEAGSADGLDRGRQPRKNRSRTRESSGKLSNLAVALHGPLFERLNQLACLSVDDSRYEWTK